MEKHDFMAEVDTEIDRILKSKKHAVKGNKENNYCDSHNLENCLNELAQEFDYFDVCDIVPPIEISTRKGLKHVLIQTVNSSFNLIKFLRETQKKLNDSLDKNTLISSEVVHLRQSVQRLQKDLAMKESQIKMQKEKQLLKKMENDELKIKIMNAKKELNLIQKENVHLENKHKNEKQKILVENEKIDRKFKQKCSHYVTDEEDMVKVFDSFKQKEQRHLKTIEKLQNNNHELLEEIVALKSELMHSQHKNRTKK